MQRCANRHRVGKRYAPAASPSPALAQVAHQVESCLPSAGSFLPQPNAGGGVSTAMRVGALSLGIMSRLIQVVRMLHQVG